MKRGTTWSYVIRVKDPETGESKPTWVGGFATEDDAKAARDEARVKARRGEYIDRNTITVAEYLDEWIEAHAVEIKPKPSRTTDTSSTGTSSRISGTAGSKPSARSRHEALPRPDGPGGKNGAPLSPRTIEYVHAVLRKAFRDAVEVDQILLLQPCRTGETPSPASPANPGPVWTPAQLRAFLDAARQHRLFAFFHLAAYTGARRGELLHLRWRRLDLEARKSPSPARRPSSTGSASRAGEERPDAHRQHRRADRAGPPQPAKVQAEDKLKVGPEWRGASAYVFTTAWGEPIHPDTVSSLFPTLIKRHNAHNPKDPLPHARLHDLRHVHAMEPNALRYHDAPPIQPSQRRPSLSLLSRKDGSAHRSASLRRGCASQCRQRASFVWPGRTRALWSWIQLRHERYAAFAVLPNAHQPAPILSRRVRVARNTRLFTANSETPRQLATSR